jgi:demethylsterigmatocystin 6-O-methyltransferase
MGIGTLNVHSFENIGPVVQALPDFLQETHYQNITESNKTVFQKAFDTDLACFAWLPNQPKRFSYLQKMMPIQRTGDWLSEFPVVEEVGDWKAEEGQAVFVE